MVAIKPDLSNQHKLERQRTMLGKQRGYRGYPERKFVSALQNFDI